MKQAASRTRRPAAQAKSDLLAGATDFLAANGIVGFSVRGCAAAIGTSHRLLLHHFGSKEHLLAAAIAELRRRWLDQALQDTREGIRTPEDVGDQFWASVAGSRERLALTLQIVGLALLDPDRYGDIVLQSTQQFIAGTAAMMAGRVDPERAQAIATAVVAAIGGLQIDLLVSGDEARVRAAFEELQRFAYLELRMGHGSGVPPARIHPLTVGLP
ncbi:MAG TPA: helix-turn-helix domain-containing protein [Acidimicrobiales bacterium]|nr:helix-turn-helix domain-containing protein [Acidimicrobiales bacterium]